VYRLPLALAAAAAILVTSACNPADVGAPLASSSAAAPTSTSPPAVPEQGSPAALAAELVVAPEVADAPYSSAIRKREWGDGWDSRGHGCDTRDLVLYTNADQGVRMSDDCRVDCPTAKPCWTSPYDGRHTRDPHELQIDHIVPVGEAAKSPIIGSGPGGRPTVPAAIAWTPSQKHAFYEDTNNLVPVTSAVNESKSDGDPAEWEPLDGSYVCEYATRYASVKVRYKVTVDPDEYDALTGMLSTCADSGS
jgi:hypothetical protein